MNIIVSKTLFIGKNLIFLKSVPSTNDYAKQLLSNSKPKNGSVILAENQTAGRGQHGNAWNTEKGKNITCSIILDTSAIEVKQQFILNKIIAIAVRNTIRDFVLDTSARVSIKWSNDILVNQKKIAGILIENTVQGNYLQNSIVGIGININQLYFDKNLNATSLYIENKSEILIESILIKLLENIESWYLKIQLEQYINSEYLKHLFWLNESRTFLYKDNVIVAKIIGTNEFGQLLLEHEADILSINQKEIQYIIQ